jgi:hypothetical protein
MKTRLKVLIVTLLFAVPAFLLGPVIWPPNPNGPMPTPEQIPFFIVLSVFDALIFGLGIAFIAFGWPIVRRVTAGSKVQAWATYISIAYLLVSWWPHLNLHTSVGMDLQGLLYIDYGFHLPLMVSVAIVAYTFLHLLRRASEKPGKVTSRYPCSAIRGTFMTSRGLLTVGYHLGSGDGNVL